MKFLELRPEQLITSNYDILHDKNALALYFELYRTGNSLLVPPVIVMRTETALHLSPELKRLAEGQMLPEYFLTDGSHRTTAACLTHNMCQAVALFDDASLAEAKEMAQRGEIFPYNLGKDIVEEAGFLAKHFLEKSGFQTVVDKTEKLISAGEIPEAMVVYYRNFGK